MSRLSKASPLSELLAGSPRGHRGMLPWALPRYAGLRVLALARLDLRHVKVPKFVSVAEIGALMWQSTPQARPFEKPNRMKDRVSARQ
jgi:hypothetical protein